MIWKWADRDKNQFVEFGHQEARLAAIEADIEILCKCLLASDGHVASSKEKNALIVTLQKIISRLERK